MRARGRRGLVASALALSALALSATGAAGQEPRRTYLRRAQDHDGPAPRLLEDLDLALGRGAAAGEVAYLFDRLLEEAAAPVARGLVVEVTPERFVGLRAYVLARCADLPKVTVDALRDLQTRAAAGASRTAGPAAIRSRYPFAAGAVDAARVLASRAIAAGDLPLARLHLDELAALHPDRPPAPEQAALAVLAAAADRAAAPAPAPPPGPPAVRWSASVGQAGDPDPGVCLVHPAYVRSAAGERVIASSGARLVVVDASDGALVGRIPLVLEASGRPPDPLTRFAARVTAWDGLAFTPLVIERWLAPGRGEGAGDFAGRFYSLVAIDTERARLAWWDGDPGPTSRAPAPGGDFPAPPGIADADPTVVAALRASHVVAVAADEVRVYVALLPKDTEPELSLFAYERTGGAGQPLLLRPSWSAPVPLFAAERPERVSPDDEPVAPELAAALTLDGGGRLLVTTDAGLAACLDAGSGDVRWLVRPEAAPVDRREQRMRDWGRYRLSARASAPPTPARLLEAADGQRAAFIAGDALVCVRVRDGHVAWSIPRGRAERVLATDSGHVVAYGQQELLIVDASSGAPRHRAPADENVCGEGVAVGRTLFLPARDGAGAKLRRIDLQLDGEGVTPRRSALVALPDHAPPFNLALSPRGILAASGRTVTLHAWER